MGWGVVETSSGQIAVAGQTDGTLNGATSEGGRDAFLFTLEPGNQAVAPPAPPVSLNQAPSAILLSNLAVDENTAAGTAVATLTTDDPDGDTLFTYALVDGSWSSR